MGCETDGVRRRTRRDLNPLRQATAGPDVHGLYDQRAHDIGHGPRDGADVERAPRGTLIPEVDDGMFEVLSVHPVELRLAAGALRPDPSLRLEPWVAAELAHSLSALWHQAPW